MPETIPLQDGWQGGPASIALELVEFRLDDGRDGPGITIELDTACDPSGGYHIELGTGALDIALPSDETTASRLQFVVLASIPQARALRDALSKLIADASEAA